MNDVGEPVDIAEWRPDPEYPTYPEGSREKRAVICPDAPPHPRLIARHRYLYKLSMRRPPFVQFWSEAVASRLGEFLNIPVPMVFAAHDRRRGDCGALIEWFYRKPGDPAQVKIDGGDYMRLAYRISISRKELSTTLQQSTKFFGRFRSSC